MGSRLQLLDQIVTLCGTSMLAITDPGTGWGARGAIATHDRLLPVKLHVGIFGRSHRGRDAAERRMQNPGMGRPVTASPGELPLIIGLWREADATVLVGMDAGRRLGLTTRHSLFVPVDMYEAAVAEQWIEHRTTTGERIIVFRPTLLSAYTQVRWAEYRGVTLRPAA